MFENAKLHIYMNIIDDTELILNEENKIYHLNLSKEQIANDIILVGDPDRVNLISDKFDEIKYKIQHREFITHTGILRGKKISAISTGICTDNIDIVVNELDALVNIDFKNRTVNKKKKSLNLIRIGTSGALQNNIKIDTILASSFALGLDSLAHFYSKSEIIEKDMSMAFLKKTKWPKELSSPYIVKASNNLISLFKDLPAGITATAPGFYGPQGRSLRIKPSITNFHDNMMHFSFNNEKIKNFEMETSALYYLGQTLGHNTLTICAVIGNRINKEYSKNYQKTIENTIDLVLSRICR